MENYTSPITPENYDRAWEYANTKYCTAKRSSVIEAIVTRLGNLIFLVLSLVLTYGLLYEYAGEALYNTAWR